MIMGFYCKHSLRLEKKLRSFLLSLESSLISWYGNKKTALIIEHAKEHYKSIIPEIPFFNTSMYDKLILVCSRLLALKKGMRYEGIPVSEFVVFNIYNMRRLKEKIPVFIRRIAGRLYISSLVRPFLKKVGRSATKNGWPTKVISGRKNEGYDMKVCTKNCQMLNFVISVGEGDLKPFCSMFDFIMAEAMELGLEQVSTIDSGTCIYCFRKKGQAYWPKSIKKVCDNWKYNNGVTISNK